MSPVVHNSLGHIGFGIILMLVFGALAFAVTRSVTRSAWIAWAMQCAYWLGRERRDYENSAPVHPSDWWLGWNLLQWDNADLWSPIVVNAAFPLALSYLLRNRA